MQDDSEGFNNPVINTNLCIECGACQKVCPVLNPLKLNVIQDVYAAWALDDNIRQSSSSGGLFSIFANEILDNGGFVVGASLIDDFTVKNIIVTNKDSLKQLRGSKYVQSTIGENLFRDIEKRLISGQQGLFCGTPCQVAGVRKYLAKEYSHFYTIDLVCHGVPSPRIFAETVQRIKKDLPNIVSYQFRDMRKWGVCNNVNVNVNGVIINKPLYGKNTSYQDAFLSNLMHRECCYRCSYATSSRIGDITLADFWGIGKTIPFKHKVRKGVSFVGVISDKGNDLFEQIKSEVFFEKRSIEEAIAGGNTQLCEPSTRSLLRDTFYGDAYSLSEENLVKKYKLKLVKKNTLWLRGVRKIKWVILRIIK
jgi:coenzyme F420-reducing hydrogenase beta subunit